MKIGWLNRLLLVLGMLICLALFAFMGALAFGYGVEILEQFVLLLRARNWIVIALLAGVAALGIIGTVRLMFMRPKRSGAVSGIVIRTDDLGTARISTQALDAMAHKHISQHKQVREFKTRILDAGSGDAIVIQAQISFLADTNIPEMCDTIRNGVKEYVQTYSGIEVRSVQVFVDAPSNTPVQTGGALVK